MITKPLKIVNIGRLMVRWRSSLSLSGWAYRSLHKLLELTLSDEIWWRAIDDIDVFFRIFANWFIVRIVFAQVIALYKLRNDLIDLGKQNSLFVFEIFHKELIWYDVSVWMTLVAILNPFIKVNCLYKDGYTRAGLSFLTFNP